MNRRHTKLAFGMLIAFVTAGTVVLAESLESVHWTKIPSITVVSAAGDPRIAAVREAVTFWNRTFAELGTSFRLGAVTVITGPVPDSDVQSLGDRVLHQNWPLTIPRSLERLPGDLLIVLSNAKFISYTAYGRDRVVIAIKNGDSFPLALPNVTRNVIAHELGHAVGLEHNENPALLMCGRPAPCRPDAFESATARFFPLSDEERNRLRVLYPKPRTTLSTVR